MTSLALVFPGQGSQSVGMLSEAHQAFPEVANTFTEASDALGFDLWSLAVDGPAEQQALTANTQPLILAASVALHRAWLAQGGPAPAFVAGHSLGEFSALVVANSLDFADAVRLVRQRGQAMQEAVPVGVGAMAAIIGLDDDNINRVCSEVTDSADGMVCAVNYNSPGQVVIAGHADPVAQAIEALKAAGAKRAMPLPVSAPFHTPLMTPAGEVLAEALRGIALRDPQYPVISNVNAQPQTDAAAITDLLVQQIAAPVQWTGCVQTLIAQGCGNFIECGPGKVLSGLIRRIDKQSACHSIETPESLQATLGAVIEGISS